MTPLGFCGFKEGREDRRIRIKKFGQRFFSCIRKLKLQFVEKLEMQLETGEVHRQPLFVYTIQS